MKIIIAHMTKKENNRLLRVTDYFLKKIFIISLAN